MDVYFNENYWGCRRKGKKDIPGEAVYLEEQFEWEGRQIRIPAVYLCEEGLVADFCVHIPAAEVEDFYKKWKQDMGEFTEEEEEMLAGENPLSWNMKETLQINGAWAREERGCGTSWVPLHLQEGEARSTEEILLDAYGCDPEEGWSFWRKSYGWPEGKRVVLRTLTFSFEKNPEEYGGIHFTTRLGEEKKQVEFFHPVTGKRHVLTIEKQEKEEIPERKSVFWFEKTPSHFLRMEYTVEPEFPMEELQLQDCARSDAPVMAKKKAGAVSIIGGADGPTSIFLAGKYKEKNIREAYSALHYEPVEEVEWRMRFHIRRERKRVVEIVL